MGFNGYIQLQWVEVEQQFKIKFRFNDVAVCIGCWYIEIIGPLFSLKLVLFWALELPL